MNAEDIQIEYIKPSKHVSRDLHHKIRLQMPCELEDTIWLTPKEARVVAKRLLIEAKGK